ncbi:hypothetical protein BYT27DRAFT_7108485 [Phlegmacium glaucopus]|nr:hypothetical protein BYT27DRAFT_7108485 [Phlegmacium glaucopus]
MPRNPPAASTLRNRNRITNKTRLKIYQGSLDADGVLIPDEDEEKHLLNNLVAGVDAEDANEHHLQEVLSAVHRNQTNERPTRGAAGKSIVTPAFIPTPDSTGVVDNYDELYLSNKWKDPTTYAVTSATVEENIINGLGNGFTYYMDERDKEWLDKNNEEARGEGTSAQGAVSGTRTSSRSAKAKGKEPEAQPVVLSEDEFELVMGVFEKVTHERTEYLHHGLETGMEFPAFADYQDVFSTPLTPATFATCVVPLWIPAPAALLRIARAVYPHWKDRRIERGGYRIIPALNGDESDILNESYICFRRREIKAARKTRASQVTTSDKLARLQVELSYPLELAKSILARETLKKECTDQSQDIWEKRLAFVDLKRKFAILNDKGDEELLIDKERPVKKGVETSRVPGLKIKTNDPHRVPLRPKERLTMIREQVELSLTKQKDLDHHWEDQIDNSYQALPVPYASKLFKYIPPSDAPWPSPSSVKGKSSPPTYPRIARAVRLRYGRGGRIHFDRRDNIPRTISNLPRSTLFGIDEPMDVDAENPQEGESRIHLEERWRFDTDDGPAVGPEGPEEQDRVLINDYDGRFLRHTMTLFSEKDHANLLKDPALNVLNAEGRPQVVFPHRFGPFPPPPQQPRRDAQTVVRQGQPTMNGTPVAQQSSVASLNGTAVSNQHQIKAMAPPVLGSQMRISSNGGMRPPVVPASNLQNNGNTLHHVAPPQPIPIPVSQHSPTSRAAIAMPHVDVQTPEVVVTSAISSSVIPTPQLDTNVELTLNGSPVRPKAQNQHAGLSVPINGFHLTNMTTPMINSVFSQNHPHNTGGLSLQQMQNLKTAFANIPATDLAALQNVGRVISASCMSLTANGANMNMQPAGANMKIPPGRQMQRANPASFQKPTSVVNGTDGQLNGGTTITASSILGNPMSSSPSALRSPPANDPRTPSRNGVHVNGQHSLTPHGQSPSLLPNNNSTQAQPSPRPSMASTAGIPSSRQQQQQAVKTTQNSF